LRGLAMSLRDRLSRALERFQAKWIPVRVKKTRQIKNLEPLRQRRPGVQRATGAQTDRNSAMTMEKPDAALKPGARSPQFIVSSSLAAPDRFLPFLPLRK
jgi:hypothetical protein